MKVKIFVDEGGAPKLEKEINEWLDKNDKKLTIAHIKQSCAIDDDFLHTLISIWYEEK